jgi:hypothetical protein
MDVFKGKKRDIGSAVAKADLGTKALGSRNREVPGGYELRERVNSYMDDLDPKKSVIGPENT